MRALAARVTGPLPAAGLLSILSLTLSHLSGCGPENVHATGDLVARGHYLVETMACNDCHTPFKMGESGPEPDRSRLLSGHPGGFAISAPVHASADWPVMISATNTAFAGPWGISYAANLTPDDTGLGVWTEELFVRAIRTGRHMGGGRPILPPMPWPSYAQATDEDLRAIWAYLSSIPRIENVVPQSAPAKPAS